MITAGFGIRAVRVSMMVSSVVANVYPLTRRMRRV
jgi:hypothetical protein